MEYILIKLEYLCRKLYAFVWRWRIRLTMNLKKEVEIGKHGTQKYVIKQGENKGKIL